MKKLILACSAFAALCLTSCSPSKEKLKADWIKTCNDGIAKAAGASSNDAMKKAYTDYCSCTADKVVEKYSVKELEEINKLQSGTPDPAKLQEVQAKLMTTIQPCLTDMQNKMMGAMGGGAAPAAGSGM